MRFFFSTLCLLFLCSFPALAKDPIRIIEGVVTKVSDGDTIQVTDALGTKVKVRLYGIDAPETAKGIKAGQPYGAEAYEALRSKVANQTVRLDVMDIDKYRRLVSIVWLKGRDINREMIAEGYAWAYRKYLHGTKADDYIAVEEQAHKARTGLWQQNQLQPPWEFRKQQKIGY